MKTIKRLTLLLLALILLAPAGSARADAAPPQNPPGGDVSPEGETQVQMVAEQVLFDFRGSSDNSASVIAWFLFNNQGTADEHLKVRFPLNGDPSWNSQRGTYYPLIDDFTAWVGEQQLSTQVVKDEDPNASQYFLGSSDIIYWSEFEMDFPVGKNVKLTVNYTSHPSLDASAAEVNYILATGAGWNGPIGKADVILRFPYILNDYNLSNISLYNDPDYSWFSGAAVTVQENELRMHWENLEPTNEANVYVWMIQPHLWQAVISGRSKVIAYPDEADSWLYLARAYAAAAQEHHGTTEKMTFLYIQAMERALALDPDNASLHAEFAKIMEFWLYGYDDYFQAVALNELATALKLDPNNADALSLLNELGGSSITLPTPGPFPTYGPTLEPTATEIPSAALTPSRLDTLTKVPPTPVPPTPTVVTMAAASTPAQPAAKNENNLPWVILLALGTFACGLGVGFVVKRKK